MNRMSSSVYDRSDSLVLQRRGRRREMSRVTTILACEGAGLGQTRDTANAGRALEQNEVLLLLRLRGTGVMILRIGARLMRRLCRQAR
jgi:hypothetical protein